MQVEKEKNYREVNGVQGLIGLVEDDIQKRGLIPGDRYMFAKDVANLFNVNQMMAHRAMKILADSRKLVRRARGGTFIGPKFQSSLVDDGKVLHSVHIMMAMDYRRKTGITDDVFLDAVDVVTPGTAVQIHYVPDSDPLGYTKRIVNQIESGGTKEGIIFIRSTEQVQRYIQEKLVLAVIFGSVYPGITEIPWLDVDQKQVGQLMAGHVLDRGYKRFVLMMYNQWRRGDNNFLNSIISVLGKAGFGMDALNIHSLPDDSKFMLDDIRKVLSECEFPTAVLCRSEGYVNTVMEVVKSMGLQIGKDVCLVGGGHLRVSSGTGYAHVQPKYSSQKQVEVLVKMLIATELGEPLKEKGVVVPVRLKD